MSAPLKSTATLTAVAASAATTIAVLAMAASRDLRPLAAAAAALFALTVIAIAFSVTKRAAATASPLFAVLNETTRLTIVALVWSALALFASYRPLGPLDWQHGWQYATGAAVLAVGFALFRQRLRNASDDARQTMMKTLRPLSAAFAAAIAVASAWLILSGKLITKKQDWLANDVFLASAAIIFVLTLLALLRTPKT